MDLKGNRITWLGHATFRIETKAGVTAYLDPWVMGNPSCPEDEKKVKKADVLICTHGHMDHIGDAVEIAKQHNPIVVGIFELCTWVGKKGAKKISPMNKGGTQTVEGIKITMTHAVHSCGIQDDDGSIVYGGEACGYVLELPGGVKLYHARRHRCVQRHADHPRSLRARDCDAAHRRPLHHEPTRGGVRLQAAAAQNRHPDALRDVSNADRPS